ncbi:uncharacterized protein CIMG_01923 [Coccidioides immitis RS]|uniref:Uncharacterized protein n=2 Tax=Coccidioides immitis TaxID=5501 RepID=J3KK88_COCIM|nr:uncharacterized protein CIMG_01923 [Coccidioides immitis RS]EAS36569.3 hypothetical protein CIMG_01923 [Coccidioides immitis RS]KMP01932.1 hypothetical protein CIRG_02071 [Coccidioides immitis RMSCC 2394]
MADMRYMTVNLEVPFGGMPPCFVAATGQQHGVPPVAQAQFIPVLPRPDIGAVPGWQPWQEPPGVIPPPYNAAPPAAAPPAAAAASPPPPTPTSPPLPSGAHIPTTTDKPVVLPSGQGYIFPQTHTTLHIIESNFPPWENPGRPFHWRSFLAPITLTLKELIEQICPDKGPKGEKVTSRGITECLELGDGAWLKGTEFWVGEKGKGDAMKGKVGQTLSEIGWDESRGTESRPVWLAVSVAYV